MDDIAKNLAANGPYDGLPGGPVCGAGEVPRTGCKTSEFASNHRNVTESMEPGTRQHPTSPNRPETLTVFTKGQRSCIARED